MLCTHQQSSNTQHATSCSQISDDLSFQVGVFRLNRVQDATGDVRGSDVLLEEDLGFLEGIHSLEKLLQFL